MLPALGSSRSDTEYQNIFATNFADGKLKSEFAERSIGIFAQQSDIKGRCGIDGGGGHGRHILTLASAVGPTGKVISYEPVARNVSIILNNIRTHLLPRQLDGIVDLRQKAIGNINGPVDFYEVMESTGLSGLVDGASNRFTKNRFQIDCVRLDDDIDLEAQRRVGFIKLDLEGGELDAMRGALQIIKGTRPIIAFENGRRSTARLYNYSKEQFFSFFDGIDYSLYCNLGLPLSGDDWDRESSSMPSDYLALPYERAEAFLEKCHPLQVALLQELTHV